MQLRLQDQGLEAVCRMERPRVSFPAVLQLLGVASHSGVVTSFVASPSCSSTEAVEKQVPAFQVPVLPQWVEARLDISTSSFSFFPFAKTVISTVIQGGCEANCRVLIPL